MVFELILNKFVYNGNQDVNSYI